jgi:hypothetical protein
VWNVGTDIMVVKLLFITNMDPMHWFLELTDPDPSLFVQNLTAKMSVDKKSAKMFLVKLPPI